MNAIVLAGSKGTTPLTQAYGLDNKAFIPLKGKPMVTYVLEILHSLEDIEEVILVGPPRGLEKLKGGGTYKVVPEKGDIIDNVLEGFKNLPPDKPVILLTSDIPLISREALQDFIEKSLSKEGDFCYPIINKESCEKKFPGSVRTYVQLVEGSYTGGNVFFINPRVVESAARKGGEFIALRKKPHLLALKLGLVFILKYAFKRLTIKEAEDKVSRLFGIKARAVITSYPEIGVDVDKVEDMELAERALRD